MTTPNVLASRYASPEVARIWSPEHKIVLERRLWIAVLRAPRDLGVDVPDGVVEAYEKVADDVDLAAVEVDRCVGCQLEGVELHLDRPAPGGELCSACLETALADEAPRARDVGPDVYFDCSAHHACNIGMSCGYSDGRQEETVHSTSETDNCAT